MENSKKLSFNYYQIPSLSVPLCRPRSDCSCSFRCSLVRVYTVCHSLCIIWVHYSLVKPHCFIFRIIKTAILLMSEFLDFYGLFACVLRSSCFKIPTIGSRGCMTQSAFIAFSHNTTSGITCHPSHAAAFRVTALHSGKLEFFPIMSKIRCHS